MTEKNTKFTSKLTIIGGFMVVLVLLASLMFIAISRIQNNETQVAAVTLELTNVGHSFIMRDAANNRALLLYRMAQSDDDFLISDMYGEFSRFGSEFLFSFNAVKTDIHRDKDRILFKKTQKSIQQGSVVQSATVTRILDGQTEQVQTLLATKIIPIQLRVRKNLMLLSRAFQNNADDELKLISKQNKFSIVLITIIGCIAIAVGVVIMFFVSQRVTGSENAFIKQRHLAEQANHAKSMFLATMSHEIRSPLAAIIGFSDLLQKSTLPQDKLDSYLASIERNSKHLLNLLNDILDISKIEAGQLEIEQITVSPFAVLDEIQSSILVDATNHGLSFVINYAFPLPDKITTDPVRLKQILLNLNSNAIKFTERGGINVNVACNINDSSMTFEVIDTGIGLTAEQQDTVFSSFTQADSSTTRRYGGSGLGLNICKQLVKKLGGEISVESNFGQGSKFSFNISTGIITKDNLVYSLDHISPVSYDNDKSNATSSLFGQVLLTEDTIDNQKLIEIYVTNTGANITIVNNGAEAVKICGLRKFDLILMDIQMPVMDGVEATKNIRLNDTETPIVALTANAMRTDYERCIDAGANEFLTKPIDLARFNQVLYKYLSSVKRTAEIVTTVNKYQQLTEKFLTDLPSRMSKILKLKNQHSWPQLEQETHKLKGLGTPFGYPEITKISAEINQCCRNNDFKKIATLVDELNNFCVEIKLKRS